MMRTPLCLALANLMRISRKDAGNNIFGGGRHQLPDKGVARPAASGCRRGSHPVQDVLVHQHGPAPLRPHRQAYPRLQAS